MNPFFLVTGTPRSRTAWMARFLSHGGVACVHEPSINFRRKDELRRFVRQPNIGASDSGMVLLWREIAEANPDARFAVVTRPVMDVIRSALNAGIPIRDAERGAVATTKAAHELAAHRRDALVLAYDDLATDHGCARLFRHCLGRDMPGDWFDCWRDQRIECDVPAQLARAAANIDGLRAVYGG